MAGPDETSIKMTAAADIADLVAWTNAVNAATDALSRYQTVAGQAPGSPGGQPGPGGGGGGGPLGPGSPPGGPPPPPVPSPPPGGGGAPPSAFQRAAGTGRQGLGFLQTSAATALGIGLGDSLTGMFLAAPQRFMALDTVLTQLSRRFRDAEENAGLFGRALGYTISEAAQLTSALGEQINVADRDAFRSYGGFSRYTGMDPGLGMQSFGRIQRMQGRALSDAELGEVLASAVQRGMDQGRLGEYVQELTSVTERQFRSLGRVDMAAALAAVNLPATVYGEGDPRRQADVTMAQGVHGMLTGGTALRTYLMRAMGYGTEGGPDYITMRIRQEAGLDDPRNLIDLFESFQQRGMGTGQMFRGLEESARGNLSAVQLKALTQSLGTPEGLARYREGAEAQASGNWETFLASMPASERKLYEQGGMFGLGAGRGISMGETVEVKLEKLYMDIGRPVASAIPGIVTTVESILGAMQNLSGVDWAATIPQVANDIARIAKWIESWTEETTSNNGSLWDAVRRGAEGTSNAIERDWEKLQQEWEAIKDPSKMRPWLRHLLTGGQESMEFFDDLAKRKHGVHGGGP